MDGKGWRAGFITFLKGVAMGAADIVPGVSGGTIALITGVYQRLIASLDAIDHRLWGLFQDKGIRAVWRHIDGNFLLVLLLGILSSILSLAKFLHFLLKDHPILIWSFFFGLIAASIYFVGKRASKWSGGNIVSFLIGTGCALAITLLPPMATPDQDYIFFFAGLLAISAMILPGISGSFILVLLGAYQAVLGAIKELDLAILGFMAAGCGVGLLTFSKVLNWMFRRYHDLTIALMSGFLLGSLNKVWPWKTTWELSPWTSVLKDPSKVWVWELVPGDGKAGTNRFPAHFAQLTDQDPELFLAILSGLLGAAIVVVLEGTSKERA
ncbi:MAG: DUF368 domain-containing protein [Flavobacteriales bacterium]